jgi:hypothetical protein
VGEPIAVHLSGDDAVDDDLEMTAQPHTDEGASHVVKPPADTVVATLLER